MLVTLNEVLKDAQKNKYAVGLFNTVNFVMAKGVITAAEEARSPVIMGTAEVLLPNAGFDDLAPLLLSMARRATVPVVLHFDHGLTAKGVKDAMDAGFTSVMYDCSTEDYDTNVRAVAEMTQYAHSRGVTMEGELGHVGVVSQGTSPYTEPDKAALFVEKTGVDALAVAIGTAHGAYKSAPKLDFERLSEIAQAVSAPLVLHGGSGLTEQDFKTAIQRGIAKVNIYTDINNAASRAMYENYGTGTGVVELMPAAIDAVREEALKKMRMFGSAGRA